MKENLERYFEADHLKYLLGTLKYALYVIVHPLDGFWDLIHEKRGSKEAATLIIILCVLTDILTLQYSGFLFNVVRWSRVNLIIEVLGIIAPIAIGVVANWCWTTLLDGKGTMSDIYIAAGYAMTPYVLVNIPLIFVSNIVTMEEGAFYTYFQYAALIWCGLLLLAAMMEVHDYSLTKAIVCGVLTVVGMAIIIFLLLLFFSLVSDAVAYFYSLYKEISYRIY